MIGNTGETTLNAQLLERDLDRGVLTFPKWGRTMLSCVRMPKTMLAVMIRVVTHVLLLLTVKGFLHKVILSGEFIDISRAIL